MGNLGGLGKGNGTLRMACGTGCFVLLVALEAGLFRRPKGRWVVWAVIDIIVTGGAGIF